VTLSSAEVKRLSNRLRDGDSPSREDLEMLSEVLASKDEALQLVASGLIGLGEEPTTRLKTSGTIVDKLRRSAHLNLTNIRDLAGARIVRRMTLDEQDALVAAIVAMWPGAAVIDRRESPSFGYRAVHVVPRVAGHSVEIQVRTLYQDTWAQMMERLGDFWGRAVRYGGQPDDPETPIGADGTGMTRGELVEAWKGTSDRLHMLATTENQMAQLKATVAAADSVPQEVHDNIAAVEEQIATAWGPAKKGVFDVREMLESLKEP
jgi:hypothetical protein